MKFILGIVFVLTVIGCASSTKVEVEPGESAQIIIVEPQKEPPTNLWNWRAREELRKKQKEDKK
jgi:hypothetical protein